MALFTHDELKSIRPHKSPRKPKPQPAPISTQSTASTLPVQVVADNYTDLRVALRLSRFAAELRFCQAFKSWLVFDGRRWTTDAPGGAAPFFNKLLQQLYAEALEFTDYAQRGDAIKAINKLESDQRRKAIISTATTLPALHINANELDCDPWLLNCLNGTITLKTGRLRPHSPSDFITRLIGIEYDPNAKCHAWEKFLNRIFDGDCNVVSYMQRYIGYILTGMASEQVLLFLFGLGCNGKSTLANIIRALLGDFAATAGAEILMVRDKRGNTNDLATLRGARLVTVSEFDDGERLAEAQIKTLTGGDPVTCRYLYGEFFSYIPRYKLILIGNHKPKVRGTDHGIWRRLHMLHFGVTIPQEERDPYLQDKLLAELPGILNWALQGCLEWQQQGLNPPDSVKAAVSEYRHSEDIFSLWIEDCCNQGECFSSPANALLASFMEHSGWRNVTPKKFGGMLSEAGFTREKSGGSIRWRGLGLQQTTSNYQDREAPF